MNAHDEQDVLAMEAARCAAIAEGDMAALGKLLDERYLHIHGTGRIGDKADYLAGVARAPRVPVRYDLVARVFGDSAVLTGGLLNTINYANQDPVVIDTSATFALHRQSAGTWIFVTGQLTPKRDSLEARTGT